jgi:hypothetical protein
MSKITIRLGLPKDIIEKVDLEKVAKRIEKEIMIEYTMKKLHGKLAGKNLMGLLTEVEEEWGL